MTTPSFTRDFFSSRIPTWREHVVPRLRGITDARWLEVGSYEGQSALWTLENVLEGPDSSITCVDVFDENVHGVMEWGGNRDYEAFFDRNLAGRRVEKLRGRGHDVMPRLISEERRFHGAYIDSDHSRRALLTELPLAWELLLPGAVLVVDDYDSPWDPQAKSAVNEFLATIEHIVLHRAFQLILLKP